MADIPVRALAPFDYTRDGRSVTSVNQGDKLDVADHHYAGLLGAGLVEPQDKAKAQDHAAAAAAALDVPAADRLRAELEAAAPAKSAKGAAKASDAAA
jgi:hypothetical protein